MRRGGWVRHGALSYPVGKGRIGLGRTLLPLLPSNDLFYDPPKLRVRLDEEGALYFKNILPREVVHAALDDLAHQMRAAGWTTEADRRRLAARDGFTVGVPYPSTGLLPPPSITYSPALRAAVGGTSVMAVLRQVLGGAVRPCTLQTLHLGAPGEVFGFRMPSVFLNRGTRLALVALVPLHDTPLCAGAPVLVQRSNSHATYQAIRQSYGQWEVESGDIYGDGCFTEDPAELLARGEIAARDEVTGAPVRRQINPFVSTALEAGDVLLLTVYTMHSFLTNQTAHWRLLGESTWTLEGDDVGPDPRYMGTDAPGLSRWVAQREDRRRYPRSLTEAKREWGLLPEDPG